MSLFLPLSVPLIFLCSSVPLPPPLLHSSFFFSFFLVLLPPLSPSYLHFHLRLFLLLSVSPILFLLGFIHFFILVFFLHPLSSTYLHFYIHPLVFHLFLFLFFLLFILLLICFIQSFFLLCFLSSSSIFSSAQRHSNAASSQHPQPQPPLPLPPSQAALRLQRSGIPHEIVQRNYISHSPAARTNARTHHNYHNAPPPQPQSPSQCLPQLHNTNTNTKILESLIHRHLANTVLLFEELIVQPHTKALSLHHHVVVFLDTSSTPI